MRDSTAQTFFSTIQLAIFLLLYVKHFSMMVGTFTVYAEYSTRIHIDYYRQKLSNGTYSQKPIKNTKKPLYIVRCYVGNKWNNIFDWVFRPRERIFSSHSNKASSSSSSSTTSHKLCLALKHLVSFGPYEVYDTGKAYDWTFACFRPYEQDVRFSSSNNGISWPFV